MEHLRTVPSLVIQGRGEQSTKVALTLTRARTRIIVRITGGCGRMEPEHAATLDTIFDDAFAPFSGALLFGGTRMVRRDDPHAVVPGITEIPPRIRARNPDAMILGVIPRTEDLRIAPDLGMIVADDPAEPYVTIVHPHQDTCLVVQRDADHPERWDAEYEACMHITEHLRTYAGWQSLLVSYNGGAVTEREIRRTAARGWHVLLIAGSGRVTDALANDRDFRAAHPNVLTAQATAASLRHELQRLGVVPAERAPAHLRAIA